MLKKGLLALFSVIFSATVWASDHHGDSNTARIYLNEIKSDNATYVAQHDAKFFQELAKGQHPRVTVVGCADSRVHTTALDATPEGDVFMIRNIGNQLATAHGSVQYGINHLGSSLLLFVGHSSCGAIKAAGGDYSALESPIKKELDTIRIDKGRSNIEGVVSNVHNQVQAAMQEWHDKVAKGELLIVGAVYDFADDMKQGAGKLNVIDVNGEVRAGKISQLLENQTVAHK